MKLFTDLTALTDIVKEALANNVVGYEDIKYVLTEIIDASVRRPDLKRVNPLLVGAPATGKSFIVKTIFEAIPDYCVYYDASMASRVGLLDHLHSYKEANTLKYIKFVCFDEIDKMAKSHQFGILNCLESGILQETKFRRNRQVDVRGITFIGTGNELKRIYAPLASRFYVIRMEKYTEAQFNHVGSQLLFRMGLDRFTVGRILDAINGNISDKTIRDVVEIGTLVSNGAELNRLIEVTRDHRIATS